MPTPRIDPTLPLNPASPLVFVVNAGSGSNDPDETCRNIEQRLGLAGRRGEFIIARPGALSQVASDAATKARATSSAVVAVGGDGTINTVAQAAYAEGCPMGLIPRGTFNYFARTHRIPGEVAEATDVLIGGAPSPVQVGLINEQVFLVNASVGLYPRLLEDREGYKKRFGRSRIVAMLALLATLATTHRALRLSIETGAGQRDVATPMLFVGNNRLQLEQMGLPEANGIDRGRIAAVMLKKIDLWSKIALLWRGATSTLGEADTVESFIFSHMTVRQRRVSKRIKVAFDGEVAVMRGPLVFRVAPRPLHLIMPMAAKATEP